MFVAHRKDWQRTLTGQAEWNFNEIYECRSAALGPSPRALVETRTGSLKFLTTQDRNNREAINNGNADQGADVKNQNIGKERRFQEKLIINELYHFKVIRLKQFEDIIREDELS